MAKPDQKNKPALTQKIPAEELRKLLSHPDAKPVSEESPSAEASQEQP